MKNQKLNKSAIVEIPIECERIIADYLRSCMIKETHSGYTYLRYAFKILYSDATAAFNIKKCVYFPIELHFDISEETVERCINYAIKFGFELSRKYNCDNIFANFRTVPSNKVFIEKSKQYIMDNYPDFENNFML